MQRIFQKSVERPRRPFFVEIDQRHLVGQARRIVRSGAMADGAAGPFVNLQPFRGIRLRRLCERVVVEGSRRGKKVGNRRGGAVAFGVLQARERMRHRRARLHSLGLLQIVDEPLRPEPLTDLVEQRALLGHQVRGLLLGGGVAVHAAEFTEQQEPALDGCRGIAHRPAIPFETRHDRYGSPHAPRHTESQQHGPTTKQPHAHATTFGDMTNRDSHDVHDSVTAVDFRP